MARTSCLYCGAELPGELVPAAPPEASFGTPPGSAGPVENGVSLRRVLIVLDLASAPTQRLGEALDMSAYEADLLARRGGFHLHRILGEELAEGEAERLRAAGLKVELLPELEVQAQPLRALGGERGEGLFELRTEEGSLTLRRREILLVVRGSIARQYQPTYRKHRMDITSLEDGFRVHFHRRSNSRPVEIDAANFEFGLAGVGSTRLELDAWVGGLGEDVPRDDGFRQLPPAFGIAVPEQKGALAAVASLSRASRGREAHGMGESVVLDNAQQFIFYSAWRAALERRRVG